MARHNLLRQFKGNLTPAQAAEGIRVAVHNARGLLKDAELLLENERWSRACALAILAIEEAGKPEIIRGLLLARDGKELKRAWQSYRSHAKKNASWILPQLVIEGSRNLEDFASIFDETRDHAQLLDSVKQIALYSDSCGNCHWSLPSHVIDANLARTIVSIAKVLIPEGEAAMSSEAELELWIKHMQPIWKQDMKLMKLALVACYEEAKEKGVLSGSHTPEDMVEFVRLD